MGLEPATSGVTGVRTRSPLIAVGRRSGMNSHVPRRSHTRRVAALRLRRFPLAFPRCYGFEDGFLKRTDAQPEWVDYTLEWET
jgi:hypothetical protein